MPENNKIGCPYLKECSAYNGKYRTSGQSILQPGFREICDSYTEEQIRGICPVYAEREHVFIELLASSVSDLVKKVEEVSDSIHETVKIIE